MYLLYNIERDLQESLLWVAYASQVPKHIYLVLYSFIYKHTHTINIYYTFMYTQPSKYGSMPSDQNKDMLDAADILPPEINTTTSPPVPTTDPGTLSKWLTTGQRRGSDSQQEAQDVLGEVVGEQLLGRLARDVASYPNRYVYTLFKYTLYIYNKFSHIHIYSLYINYFCQ